jgi:hypothetical protein
MMPEAQARRYPKYEPDDVVLCAEAGESPDRLLDLYAAVATVEGAQPAPVLRMHRADDARGPGQAAIRHQGRVVALEKYEPDDVVLCAEAGESPDRLLDLYAAVATVEGHGTVMRKRSPPGPSCSSPVSIRPPALINPFTPTTNTSPTTWCSAPRPVRARTGCSTSTLRSPRSRGTAIWCRRTAGSSAAHAPCR